MWPLLNTAIEANVPLKDKMTYLNVVTHVQNLRFEDESGNIKDQIGQLVTSPVTRYDGLLLMEAVLLHSPTYINDWGKYVLGSLKCQDSYVVKELSLRVLSQIILNFGNNSSYLGAFQLNLPEILELLLVDSDNNQGFLHSCESLAVCMRHLPQLLSTFHDKIENFIIRSMDSVSTETIEALSNCFAALPKCLKFVHAKGTAMYMDHWLQLFTKTINTVNIILSEIYKVPAWKSKLPYFNIDFGLENSFCGMLSRVRTFSSLCRCLAKLISSETCRVRVPTESIFQLVDSILQFKEILQDKGLVDEIIPIATVAFPLLQNAAFVLVESLVLNFTVVEQGYNFTRLLVKSIEAENLIWAPSGSTSQVRSTTWKVLGIWLKQYGAKGSFQLVSERSLIEELLKDVAFNPTESEVSDLNTNVKIDENKIAICIQALKALENVIDSGGLFLDKKIIENISTTALRITRKIQFHLNPAKQFPFPYTNEKCRKGLYELLLTCSVHGDPLQTKSIMQACNLFSIALNDPNIEVPSVSTEIFMQPIAVYSISHDGVEIPEVREVCHKAFKMCRFFLNPKKPPPDSTIPNQEIVNRLPPPVEESLKSDWEINTSWNVNGHSTEDQVASVSPVPCQINAVYHNDEEKVEIQRNLLPLKQASPTNFNEHGDSHDNGNYRTLSKHSSQSDVCDESEGMEEYRNYEEEEANPEIANESTYVPVTHKVSLSVDVQPTSAEIEATERTEDGISDNIHHDPCDESAQQADQNGSDSVLDDEVTPMSSPREMVPENGMEVSDEDSGEEDEEVEEEEEDEDVNEYLNEGRCSPEFEERPVKRQKIIHEEEQSSDYEEDSNDMHSPEHNEKVNNNQHGERPGYEESVHTDEEEEEEKEMEVRTNSPTLKEMCSTFVLAEPTDVS